jgi:hypothetical protein
LDPSSRLQQPTGPDAPATPRTRPWLGIAVLLAALAPALAALAAVPWFVTQDGPAHLYNAEILARSFDPGSPFRAAYRVNWQPLPNWAGHLVQAGLYLIASPRRANLAVNALTLAGFAGSVLWLRWRIAGACGLGPAALLAALLSMNVAWLLGFTSFLLGACLFPLTLGLWWTGRHRLGGGRVAGLALLLVLGYFSHLISLVLTVIGLAVLAVATPSPGPAAWTARLARTTAAALPLLPLGSVYFALSRRGGGMSPEWNHLTTLRSWRAWVAQFGWVDPISIASKRVLPFLAAPTRGAALLAPVVWLEVALGLALAATIWTHARTRTRSRPRSRPERRGWFVLAALLILGGLAAPDTLGPSHGHYLPQRIVLLGLVALVPVLDLDPRRWAVRGCVLALVVAVSVQSALVWDHAFTAQRTAGAFWRARAAVGAGQRVAALLVRLRGRFRANPLLHADCLLGLGTGNVIWGNYETRYYYFPVQFQAALDRPDSFELEQIDLQDDPSDSAARAERWERLLARHHAAIDVLVVWERDPRLEAITARWFTPGAAEGPLRIWRHR